MWCTLGWYMGFFLPPHDIVQRMGKGCFTIVHTYVRREYITRVGHSHTAEEEWWEFSSEYSICLAKKKRRNLLAMWVEFKIAN